MRQPRSMRNLVSLGVEVDWYFGRVAMEKLFTRLQDFAPSLKFLAISAKDGFSKKDWDTLSPFVFNEVPETVTDLVLSFDPSCFDAFPEPSTLCTYLPKTTTLHVQAPGDPPRGKTWAKPLDKPWRNPDGSYRHRWPRWMQLEYSIDVHERSVPPDRFFSYRGEWPLCDGSYDGSSTETGEGDY